MKCPNCNKEISDGFKFCPYCATPLVANICPHCGSKNIPADSKFCPDCGKPIKGTSEGSPSGSESGADTLEFTVGDVSFMMIRVEGGTFTMGATSEMENAYGDEKPTHQVTLSDYSIGETQVTQALWEAVMGSNPSCFKGDDLPVEEVSWDDCQNFIKKLNAETGRKFRLPTEAEWEFAARGGIKSNHTQYSGSDNINDVAWYNGNSNDQTHRLFSPLLNWLTWYNGNSNDQTHPVKTKKPNELGIYDMSGNVWEWCSDWYGDEYEGGSQTDPTGPASGSYRVSRGGSWLYGAWYCRSSCRRYFSPDVADNYLGFRLVLSE